jgi:hypothetical protein
MQPIDSPLDSSTRLQTLTRDYSRYSRSAGGLSAVAGGALCLFSFLAGLALPPTLALQAAVIATPVLWLVGKQWLVHRYYQRLGHVEELTTRAERRYHLFYTGFTALVSLHVTWSVLTGDRPFSGLAPGVSVAGYLAVVLALPLIVWRWLRTPLEYIVGVFLLCQAAVAFHGKTYGLDLGTAMFPIAAVALIVIGVRDHRRFLRLQTELRGVLGVRGAVR